MNRNRIVGWAVGCFLVLFIAVVHVDYGWQGPPNHRRR